MISLCELFKIGIGPSSSHTMGPMQAARQFVTTLNQDDKLEQTQSVICELYGSLAATGRGHATDRAVLMGLMGYEPATVDISKATQLVDDVYAKQRLALAGKQEIEFDSQRHLVFVPDKQLPKHPNALILRAVTDAQKVLFTETYYSVGGGFVLTEAQMQAQDQQDDSLHPMSIGRTSLPYPFQSAEQLLALCTTRQLNIAELMTANEHCQRTPTELNKYLEAIWQVMQACVQNGCRQGGILPGGLTVKRRAQALYQQLLQEYGQSLPRDSLAVMDWVNLYALAVNEENAGGGRVVTAPTNGAAGIIPAVLHYYRDFCQGYSEAAVREFLLVAGAIGILIKTNASISGAEVGCQGEVGSACAMAAAGLTHVLGGSPAQCLNAAEIGIEHNLGLTCDPVAGLVQVPCIERNAMASVKAINASRLALRGSGEHLVSLDAAIQTMRDTGRDMLDKYKETSRGGLASVMHHNPQLSAQAAQAHLDKIAVTNLDVSVNYSQC